MHAYNEVQGQPPWTESAKKPTMCTFTNQMEQKWCEGGDSA